MSKKAKYSILIIFIIILAALAYLFIFNKTSQNEPAKIVSVEANLTPENIAKQIELAREDVARQIQADAARRAQEAASSTPAASSTGNINIK